MTQFTAIPETRSLPPLIAWRNALGITLLGWFLLGLLNFCLLANYLASTLRNDLLLASFLLSVGFTVSAAIIVTLIIFWQRRHGETLADLGWRRPTTVLAIVVAVIYGALWTALSYYGQIGHGEGSFLAITWERVLMIPIGVFLAFTEELMFRGFFMEQLRRGGVPTWLQIIASGICIGSYHGVLGFHYSVTFAIYSAILFGILAAIFVLGKRSLTPNTIAHAMTHVFGDPFLTMGILYAILYSFR
ncbi:MAG: CPBP family intramembrane metalloprotease [Chloroflexota bacterium]|nr:CPBP family intramembrane metalloprotease [Chloroflexota bacterium]